MKMLQDSLMAVSYTHLVWQSKCKRRSLTKFGADGNLAPETFNDRLTDR